ncbi:MAG: 2-amino-4-hydroxy-6-hydroxymethyldihydropteridine diphosphokinase [Polyangiaceae bacterium]
MAPPDNRLDTARIPLTGRDVVVGFGANLGDRAATLARALSAFAPVARVSLVSSLYETAPVGPVDQPSFRNGAALVRTEATPLLLLRHLLAIELELGRVRDQRWGPRIVDLDLLWIDGVVVHATNLTVPHPELPRRAFALAPLVEVAPEARDPRTGERLADVLTRTGMEGVTRTARRLGDPGDGR